MARRDGGGAPVVRRAWRLGPWSLITVPSVAAAVIAAYTETGGRRLALGDAPFRPSAAPPSVSDREAIRLADALRALSADRDRLAARVSALERNLDDVTGSIPHRTRPQRGAPRGAPPPPRRRPPHPPPPRPRRPPRRGPPPARAPRPARRRKLLR